MPTLQQLTSSQTSPEIPINEDFETLEHQAVYGKRHPVTAGLVWGYYGGRWGGFLVAAGSFTLAASTSTYIVVEIATGIISQATTSTNWLSSSTHSRVYKITTSVAAVTAVEDHRAGPGGVHGGAGAAGGVGVTGLQFTASGTTTDTDPGPGNMRWNNAVHASATQLYIDNLDGDGTNLATYFAGLPANSYITITKATDPETWQRFKASAVPIDGTGYYKFTVTLQAQEGTTIAAASAVLVAFDAGGGVGGTSTIGKHSIPIVAAGMRPSISGGCSGLSNVVTAANQPDILTLDFDPTTEEYAQFSIPMPKRWSLGSVTFKAIWSHPTTTINFGVVWSLQAVAVSDNDALAVAYGTAVAVTDTGGVTNNLYQSPESGVITVAGTPAAEDVVFFRLFRKAADAADTMVVDARLHGVVLFIATNAENDA